MAAIVIPYDLCSRSATIFTRNRITTMDAGVLQLHVFPHEPAIHRPKLLAEDETILPTLTPVSPIERTAPISLVIPTFFNKSLKNDSLRHLLNGLEASTTVEEVILVVTGDPSHEHEYPNSVNGNKRIVIVPCERNQRARARNLGAAAATHDMLLFLDDDMVLHSWKTIDVLVSQLLTENYDCALFPRRNYARFPLVYDGTALESTIDQWRTQDATLDETLVLDPVRHGCSFKTMAFCFPGCFMLIRKNAFELIGGFPAEFVGWGFEDSDFAVRATAVLRVLNLFRKSHPLLHIDHPVSPYKSEEYEQNFRQFLAAHAMSDMDRLCTHVIGGEDFLDGARPGERANTHFAPLEQLAKVSDLPTFRDDAVRRDVVRHYEHILEARLEKGCDAIPRYVVLHGSRSSGTATSTSDYDLLFLFRGGILREFFTCDSAAGPSLDFEFSDCDKFERIAQRPVFYPLYGPLELEKIACGRLLFGEADDWDEWVRRQLRRAIDAGRVYWFLYALGMSMRNHKHGSLREPFLNALRCLLVRDDSARFRDDLRLIDNFQPELVGRFLRSTLDAQYPGWVDDVTHHRRVFAFQVPEVWSALRWLVHFEH